MSKIPKQYSKHQKYLKYFNIQVKPIYMLSLDILAILFKYVCNILFYFYILWNLKYMMIFLENSLSMLSDSEPNPDWTLTKIYKYLNGTENFNCKIQIYPN